MGIRNTYLKMIRAFPGGIEAMAAAIGMPSGAALSNRIYELKGQRMHVDSALAMQAASRTTLFAEAIAEESGCTLVVLPTVDEDCDNEELFKKFTQIVDQIGQLAKTHAEAIEDGELDDTEEVKLRQIAATIHRRVEELLALTVRIYKHHPEHAVEAVAAVARVTGRAK